MTGEDDTEWNRIRLARRRVITDVEDVVATVTADHSAFEISEEVLPRVIVLLRLLTEQALVRHGEIAVSKKRRQARPLLTGPRQDGRGHLPRAAEAGQVRAQATGPAYVLTEP
ncbi:hypothetical protein ABZ454_00230 [Streptomyces sp. NPDC005803]|uniref:hypothetical protein n=1 Tax=Streptomyces sp. NPDC005803 TaxID=3154297 RepID=UPI0033C2D3CE